MEDKPQIMPYSDIPWAHWGIHSRHAFSYENALKIARKVWDPVSSTHIQLGHSDGNHPINKVYGRYSLVSPIRGARPVQNVPSTSPQEEVFAPILDGRDYGIVIALGRNFHHSPFSIEPRLEDVTSEQAVTIINRFGSYARYVDPEIAGTVDAILSSDARIAHGMNLVTLPTRYLEKVEEASATLLACMLDSLAASITYVREEASQKGIQFVPINAFFNIGPEVGGTLKRLHSQTYIDLNQDGHGTTLESLLKTYESQFASGGCTLCNGHLESYKIADNEEARMFAAPSPMRNYEIWISPKRHFEDLTQATFGEFEAFSELLISAFSGLNELKVHPSRNILIYQRPLGYDSKFHVLARIVPYESVGGQEIMDDCRVARINPLDVAAEMREIVKCLEPAYA